MIFSLWIIINIYKTLTSVPSHEDVQGGIALKSGGQLSRSWTSELGLGIALNDLEVLAPPPPCPRVSRSKQEKEVLLGKVTGLYKTLRNQFFCFNGAMKICQITFRWINVVPNSWFVESTFYQIHDMLNQHYTKFMICRIHIIPNSQFVVSLIHQKFQFRILRSQ